MAALLLMQILMSVQVLTMSQTLSSMISVSDYIFFAHALKQKINFKPK